MSRHLVELGRVVQIVMGQAPPGSACNKEGTGVVFVKAGEFQERSPDIREWTTQPLKMAASKDTLVCVVGATAGKVNYSTFECAIGRSVAAVRAQPDLLDPEFLYHFLGTKVGELRDRSQGAAQGVITREMLQDLTLYLPPLAEQRRIAAILDQADALRAKRRESLAQLETLKQSIFLDMFGDPTTNSCHWKTFSMSELAVNENYLRVPVKSSDREARTGAYPYYGASGIIDWVNEYVFDGERLLIGEDGANLLSRSTPVAYMATGKFWVNNHAHVLASNGRARLRFLEFFIESLDLKPYISGSAQPKLNKGNLDRIPVPLPPLLLQDEFVRRICGVDQLQMAVNQSRSESERLFASLQHRAFRGEL